MATMLTVTRVGGCRQSLQTSCLRSWNRYSRESPLAFNLLRWTNLTHTTHSTLVRYRRGSSFLLVVLVDPSLCFASRITQFNLGKNGTNQYWSIYRVEFCMSTISIANLDAPASSIFSIEGSSQQQHLLIGGLIFGHSSVMRYLRFGEIGLTPSRTM